MTCSGIIRKDGRIPHLRNIILSDALDTSAGACLGCSTVTAYVESATGFAEGGRTGVSALVVALCFAASLFFAPLFLAIPAAATAPVMVIAGLYLFSIIRHIKLSDPLEAMPAFLTILLMPVTGSITDGIIVGLSSYIILSFLCRWLKKKSNN
jgi:AGZA family xanthine/uracil permease-like MFS transporter